MQAPVMVTVQVQIPAGALPGSTFFVAAPGGARGALHDVDVVVPPVESQEDAELPREEV